MITEDTYDFLVSALVEKLENVIGGVGARDDSVKKGVEADLCLKFERYMYGKESRSLFLVNKSERLQIFNGRFYESATPDTLTQVVKRVMMNIGIGGVYAVNSCAKIAEQCYDALRLSSRNEFKPDRHYIAFQNGIYDLKNARLVPFDVKYKTDLYMDFNYRNGATSELFDTKLCEIIPDADMRATLQMFFGCLLLDRDESKVEYVCFLLGPGGNGKSVLVDAVVNTFGDDLFGRFSPEQLFKSQQSMFNLAELDGKLANFCDDVSNKDFSGGDFKSFVSGAMFQARYPYAHNFFKVKAPYLICCANEMPPTVDDTEGFHRRILPIISSSITRTGKDKDPKLTYKLKAEEVRQAIFNWVLEGYYRVLENNGDIILGEHVVDAKRELCDDSNSTRRWIRDMGYIPETPKDGYSYGWNKLQDWYAEYKRYCEENGERNPQKSVSVSKTLKNIGFYWERRGTGTWFYFGRTEEQTQSSGTYMGSGIEKKEYRTKQEATIAARKEYAEREAEENKKLEDLPF